MPEIPDSYVDTRIDKYLRQYLTQAPLNMIYLHLRKKDITINNKKAKQDYRIQAGDTIQFHINITPYLATPGKQPVYKQRFIVLYEDKDLLIVDKPAGLASHGGTGIEDNLIAEVRTYLKDKTHESSLANRLDRETSGIVLIGKNKPFLRKLNDALRERTVQKYYLALVNGTLKEPTGTITENIQRIQKNFETKSIVSDAGKLSIITYWTEKVCKNTTLLKIQLETGRMHQIRVQLAHQKNFIIGDKTYGEPTINKHYKLNRLFLHATNIQFKHPTTGKMLDITAPLPAGLQKILEQQTL